MTNTEPKFEEALLEFEDIIRRLEAGNIELEQAITLYSRGQTLKELCEKKLNEAKLKVDKILEKDGQAIGLEKFQELN